LFEIYIPSGNPVRNPEILNARKKKKERFRNGGNCITRMGKNGKMEKVGKSMKF
jgi:hypothetical protein